MFRCYTFQGETDTIGEYVTLYQRQRALLKEQASKCDNQINEIHTENVQVKVVILNSVGHRLVAIV